MSDQPHRQDTAPSRTFIPEVKSLERRFLLSTTIPHSDVIVGHPNPPHLGGLPIQRDLEITDMKQISPRVPPTGGLAIQTGSVLNCVVGRPKGNTVQTSWDITKHFVEMSWNFGQPQAFSGVTTMVIQAQRARTNQFTFHLTQGDTVTAVTAAAGTTFQQPGPSAGSPAIELSPHRPADPVSAGAAGHPLAHLHNEHGGLTVETDTALTVAAANRPEDAKVKFNHGGLAVQTGSELTVTVNRPTTNVVELKYTVPPAGEGSAIGSAVQVEWNGGTLQSFTGVATIVVNTRNARKDQVTLADTSA
jgi:hypothetical protein